MALQPSEVTEVAIEEELGYFFRRLGELCFHAASDQDYGGPACSLAVASSCGAVFFADSQGLAPPNYPCEDQYARVIMIAQVLHAATHKVEAVFLDCRLQVCMPPALRTSCQRCRNGTARGECSSIDTYKAHRVSQQAADTYSTFCLRTSTPPPRPFAALPPLAGICPRATQTQCAAHSCPAPALRHC